MAKHYTRTQSNDFLIGEVYKLVKRVAERFNIPVEGAADAIFNALVFNAANMDGPFVEGLYFTDLARAAHNHVHHNPLQPRHYCIRHKLTGLGSDQCEQCKRLQQKALLTVPAPDSSH